MGPSYGTLVRHTKQVEAVFRRGGPRGRRDRTLAPPTVEALYLVYRCSERR